jgi:hypothetical protein
MIKADLRVHSQIEFDDNEENILPVIAAKIHTEYIITIIAINKPLGKLSVI